MKATIESSGRVPGVNVTLLEIPERQTKSAVSCQGVSFVNNIQYESDCLRVWKAYNIGPGKIVLWSKFGVPAIERELSSIVDLGNERSMQLPFVALKPRTVTLQKQPHLTAEVIMEEPVKTEAPILNCFLVLKKVVS